jgi:hypothetical protein
LAFDEKLSAFKSLVTIQAQKEAVIPWESFFISSTVLMRKRLPRKRRSAGFQPADKDVCATFSSCLGGRAAMTILPE